MNIYHILLIPGMLTVALGAQDSAADRLAFERKNVELTLETGAQMAEIKFPFANKSDKTVEVESLNSACSCINGSLKDGLMTYKPGSTGEVIARFNVGNLSGTVDKQLLVRFKGDPSSKPSLVLNAKVTIPEVLEITPRTLNWNAGDPPTPKSYRIRVTHKEPIQITSVVATNDHFRSELKAVRDGWEYEITITPKATSETAFGIIKINTNCSIARYRIASAFALVRQPSGNR